MYISEIKLRKLIRKQLLKEEKEGFQKQRTLLGDTVELFNQTINLDWEMGRLPWENNTTDILNSKYSQALFYGPDAENVIPVLLVGKTSSSNNFIIMADKNAKIPKGEEEFFDKNRRDIDDLGYVTRAIKKLKPDLGKNAIDKLKAQLGKGNVYYAKSTNELFYPLSQDEKAGVGGFFFDTGVEFAAATFAGAAALTAPSPLSVALEGIGNSFNVVDLLNKIKKGDFSGAAFAAIGLIPGGDSAAILNKLGVIDDVFPGPVAKEVGEFIIGAFEGDSLKTIEEIVKSSMKTDNDPAFNMKNVNPIMQKLGEAGKGIGQELLAIYEKAGEDGVDAKGNVTTA